MKSTAKFMTAAAAALVVGSSIAARADTATAATPPADTTATPAAAGYATQASMLKSADQALAAVNSAHLARLALFNNDIATAKDNITTARSDLADAAKTLASYQVKDTANPASGTNYVPFDLSMALTDTFVPSDENQDAVNQASLQIKAGTPDDALQTLRAANVQVDISAAMLPVDQATSDFDKALAAIDKGDYFGANLALKSLEDSVIVRTFSIDAIPQQGDASQATG